ncbi:MAG: class I tRNA ligase family protein, partial [Gammaproteobacteria bacterium]
GITLEALVAKRTSGLMRPDDAPKIEAATRKQFPSGIASYGADALRYTFASLATQGRDVRFDLGRIDGYRNFCNKIWNATRFVLMTLGDKPLSSAPRAASYGLAERWIRHRLRQSLNAVREGFDHYRFDFAAQAIYAFVWDEYCDWYIELAKITLHDNDVPDEVKVATRHTLAVVLEASLRMMHPLVPFISDELWGKVAPLLGKRGSTVMLEPYPAPDEFALDEPAAQTLDWMKTVVLGVRRIRAENNLEPSRRIPLKVVGGSAVERRWLHALRSHIQHLARVESIERSENIDDPNATSTLAGETTLLVPLLDLLDRDVERERLTKEIDQMTQDLQRVQQKLANQSFVAKAPAEVVAKERKRAAELTDQITRTSNQLARLQN